MIGHVTSINWDRDPLRGAYGLHWYERKPSSLSQIEWQRLDQALAKGVISAVEYVEWKTYVS